MEYKQGIVLLVDDAEESVAALEMAFERSHNLSIQHAASAEHALRILDDRGPVAALITDVNLPSMDGLQLVSRIRAGGRHAQLPIIVVSADTDPRMPKRALDAGANAFFPKPYSPAAVRKKIEELIHAY
jgi:CheY-like chemotaxis protein